MYICMYMYKKVQLYIYICVQINLCIRSFQIFYFQKLRFLPFLKTTTLSTTISMYTITKTDIAPEFTLTQKCAVRAIWNHS